jgi:CBS domain-containing protein
MTCADLMTKSVAFCWRDDRVDVAARVMRDRNIGALVVVGPDNRPVGMITDRDIAVGICANAEDSYYKRVKEIMRSPVVCCRDSEDIAAVLKAMTENHVRRVAIIDGEGRLVGIISVDDLAQSLDSETIRPLFAGLSVAGILKPTTPHR